MDTERDRQIDEFFADYEDRLLTLAKDRHWNNKGFELNSWTQHLLPDGFECPEDETYAELHNALVYYETENPQ